MNSSGQRRRRSTASRSSRGAAAAARVARFSQAWSMIFRWFSMGPLQAARQLTDPLHRFHAIGERSDEGDAHVVAARVCAVSRICALLAPKPLYPPRRSTISKKKNARPPKTRCSASYGRKPAAKQRYWSGLYVGGARRGGDSGSLYRHALTGPSIHALIGSALLCDFVEHYTR